MEKYNKEFQQDSTIQDIEEHHAGLQHTDKSNKTSKEILRDRGITPKSKHSSPEDRIELFEWCFENRKIFIHKRCQHSIIAYNGGFCRKEKEGSEHVDKDPSNPYHNIADSDGYPLFAILGSKRRENESRSRRTAGIGIGSREIMDKLRQAFRPNRGKKPNYGAGY